MTEWILTGDEPQVLEARERLRTIMPESDSRVIPLAATTQIQYVSNSDVAVTDGLVQRWFDGLTLRAQWRTVYANGEQTNGDLTVTTSDATAGEAASGALERLVGALPGIRLVSSVGRLGTATARQASAAVDGVADGVLDRVQGALRPFAWAFVAVWVAGVIAAGVVLVLLIRYLLAAT